MKLLDLFSGIGGFSLAASWAGIETIAFVEIDCFCQKVLGKNFNGQVVTYAETVKNDTRKRGNMEEAQSGQESINAPAFSCNKYIPIYPDITKFSGTPYRGAVDIISGGIPCQPASCAGKRRGKEDDRWLWGEAYRVIAEVCPKWIVIENVAGLLTLERGVVFDNLLSELESIGYETQPFIIPACALNAPHRRDRVWIVANAIGTRTRDKSGEITDERGRTSKNRREGIRQGNGKISTSGTSSTDCHAPDTINERRIGRSSRSNINRQRVQAGEQTGSEPRSATARCWEESWLEVATRLCRVDDGIPEELYKLETSDRVARLKALGNSIVPQIAYQIFKGIIEIT